MQKLTDRIRVAAFDLDGTLIDTLPDLAAAVNLMLSMLGATPLSEQRVRALIGHGVDQLVLSALEESLGERQPHAAQRSAALALFRRLYGQALFQRSALYPGVMQTLRSLAQVGIQLVCITNKDSTFALPLLQQAQLSELLAFTLCADRLEDRKPSPTMLLAACSRLGVAPADMLYVGDSGGDISAAQAAGCRVLAVGYGYGNPQVLAAARPDGLIGQIDDLVTLYARPGRVRADLDTCPTGAA